MRAFAVFALQLALTPYSKGEQAVLWQAPGNITVNDWTWGAGGEAKAPEGPFQFVEEDFNGTNPKIRVRDAKGDQWTMKFGGEVHSEVFASRLLYASGYLTTPSYFVAAGVVTGAHNLKRARLFIARDGSFRFARFKLRDHKKLARIDDASWTWTGNPFLGTPQLKGLKILMMLLSNWDAKDKRDGKGSNTAVYSKPGAASSERYYAFDDWGAGMGKWGGFFARDKWDPEGYAAQTRNFARSTASGEIEWGYKGKHGEDIASGIALDDVRWLLQYLSPITDEELIAGLRASGATESEIAIYTRSLRERIGQLQQLASGAPVILTAKGGRD